MSSLRDARKNIRPTTNTTRLFKRNAGVPDILDVIFLATRYGPAFTQPFAGQLRGRDQVDSAKNVWRFVKSNVVYKRDAPGKEIVKSPGKLVYDGAGDCKSFSVLIGSLLTNLGITWFYRVAFYDPQEPNAGHIYPVAIIGGREVIVDAVHDAFDEQAPFWKATDYTPGGEKIKALKGSANLGGLPGESPAAPGNLLKTAALIIGLILIFK